MISAISNNNINNTYNNKIQYLSNDTKNFTAHIPKVMYKQVEKQNIWHKYPLKYIVYSNDFGEAVRPVIGNMMARLSWIPSVSYTLLALNSSGKKDNLAKELAFQGIASFLLPYLTLRTTRHCASKAIDKLPQDWKTSFKQKTQDFPKLDKFVKRFAKNNKSGYKNIAVSTAGIGVLLACVKPIDEAVMKLLNKHFG